MEKWRKRHRALNRATTFQTHFLVDPLDAPTELRHRRVVHEEVLDGRRLVLERSLGIPSGNRWLLLLLLRYRSSKYRDPSRDAFFFSLLRDESQFSHGQPSTGRKSAADPIRFGRDQGRHSTRSVKYFRRSRAYPTWIIIFLPRVTF